MKATRPEILIFSGMGLIGVSLVMSLAMVGILINIARQTTDEFGDEERRSIKERGHHV